MIWHKRELKGKVCHVAETSAWQYHIANEAGLMALRFRKRGDTAGELLGLYPTEAHAKDAADDHHGDRPMGRKWFK